MEKIVIKNMGGNWTVDESAGKKALQLARSIQKLQEKHDEVFAEINKKYPVGDAKGPAFKKRVQVIHKELNPINDKINYFKDKLFPYAEPSVSSTARYLVKEKGLPPMVARDLARFAHKSPSDFFIPSEKLAEDAYEAFKKAGESVPRLHINDLRERAKDLKSEPSRGFFMTAEGKKDYNQWAKKERGKLKRIAKGVETKRIPISKINLRLSPKLSAAKGARAMRRR